MQTEPASKANAKGYVYSANVHAESDAGNGATVISAFLRSLKKCTVLLSLLSILFVFNGSNWQKDLQVICPFYFN